MRGESALRQASGAGALPPRPSRPSLAPAYASGTSRGDFGGRFDGDVAPVVDAGASAAPNDFDAFFRALLPRSKAIAYRIVGNTTDAEDAAAEAFARAHASWWRVGQLPYREAWLLRVTSNVAVDMLRRRRTVPRGHDPGGHEDDSILHLSLVQALAALPRRQREAIALRFLGGYSEAETAAAMRVSLGTVKKAVHRGMASLRERLGADWSRHLGEGGLDAL